ncbi:MAG: DUF4143 domain-containing protein [Propionibacteriaceae bacterium]|nr:DUF4143 domain-containing protein [Propionibacteriaceae bacterium]
MPEAYEHRLLDDVLDDLLAETAAVALVGPKAVGKTATAQRRARTVFRLDDALSQEAYAIADRPLATAPGPILLDEWQRVPETWDQVRRAVDDGAPPGRFLLTGSAAPVGASIHSGAGRIVPVRMRPLSLAERGLATPAVSVGVALRGPVGDVTGATDLTFADYAREITASGFPGLRGYSERTRTRHLSAYLDNVVNREFPEQGLVVRRPDTLRRWLRAYAAATSTNASYTAILDAATPGEAAKPAASTTLAYRDTLSSLWLLDDVGPWDPTGTAVSRISQAPKHFLADPALAVLLLGLDETTLLDGPLEPDFGPKYGSIAGRLFEALIALSLQTYAMVAGAHLSYLRTRNGDHEVDFLIQRGQSVVGVEVKLAPMVTDADVRHLVWLRGQLGTRLRESIIVTTGPHAYRRPDGILVVPAALLGP